MQEFQQDIKAKPFLKWAGGKTQILKQLENYYPIELKFGLIKNYYEPFLGGGAVFFDIIRKYNIENAYLFDVNNELILTYRAVQKNVDRLLDNLEKHKRKYIALDEKKRSEYFYVIREKYNKTKSEINHSKYCEKWADRAAMMIFLNKTCFNGLFRLNRKGEFNVPFGKYINPQIYNESELLAVSSILKKVKIGLTDFEAVKVAVRENSFLYFDPPYRPLSNTSNFTTYSTFEFDDNEQIRLGKTFRELDELGCKVMLSNSDPTNIDPTDSFFEKLYAKFRIRKISATRMINCNGEKRGKINELVITNY